LLTGFNSQQLTINNQLDYDKFSNKLNKFGTTYTITILSHNL